MENERSPNYRLVAEEYEKAIKEKKIDRCINVLETRRGIESRIEVLPVVLAWERAFQTNSVNISIVNPFKSDLMKLKKHSLSSKHDAADSKVKVS